MQFILEAEFINKYNQTPLYGHPIITDSLHCFVPGEGPYFFPNQ